MLSNDGIHSLGVTTHDGIMIASNCQLTSEPIT
jgi:hypothetical protein